METELECSPLLQPPTLSGELENGKSCAQRQRKMKKRKEVVKRTGERESQKGGLKEGKNRQCKDIGEEGMRKFKRDGRGWKVTEQNGR